MAANEPNTLHIPEGMQQAAGKVASTFMEGAKEKALDAVNPAHLVQNAASTAVYTIDKILTNIPIIGWAAGYLIPQETRIGFLTSTGNMVASILPDQMKGMFGMGKTEVAQAPADPQAAAPAQSGPVKPSAATNAALSPSAVPNVIKPQEPARSA